MKRILTLLLLLLAMGAFARGSRLLPRPREVAFTDGVFSAREVSCRAALSADAWREFLLACGMTVRDDAPRSVEVCLVKTLPGVESPSDEAYRLEVTRRGIRVEALSARGAYWALQTLRQLRDERGGFPCCHITDYPAFRVRGFMHDVGRSFLPVEELKRQIALLSHFKINTFHWHLTENQAWRLESRIFPMLNDSVNMTRLPGCYYTLDEARGVVDFARRHGVTVIPEIDMPGHSAAFRRAFRHDMQSPEGMKILRLLIDEVCETFDGPYLHIGTDEVPFTNPDFVPRMVEYVRSRGKKVISWNPGWNYRAGEIDMTQLWSARGKAQEGIPAIDCRLHYLNHYDTFGDLVALYNSRVCNVTEGDGDHAGAILAVWNDRVLPSSGDIVRQNHFYPNMLALAERSWQGGGEEYFDGRGVMLPTDTLAEEFRAFADFERRLLWHKEHTLPAGEVAYVRQTDVRWAISDPFPNGGDLTKVFPPEQQPWQREWHYGGKSYSWREAVGAGIYLRHVWGDLIPAFYSHAGENSTAYAHTWVYSPDTRTVGAWLETQHYSRSEKDIPPRRGTWDYRGSRLWINGEEVRPPHWSSGHASPDNEIPLGNENLTARPPVEVTLRKGWNEVLWKLPVGSFRTREVRLVKWMFTTVFVTPDGECAAEGLRYATEK